MRLSAVTFLLCAVLPLQAEILTLAKAQELLFSNNLDVLAAEAELRKAAHEIDKSNSAFWPSLDASASYSLLSRKSSLHIPHPMIPDSVISMEIGPKDRAELGVDISYPFFAGFSRVYASAGNRETYASKQAFLESVKNRAALCLGLLYFQWALSFKQAVLRGALVDQLEAYTGQVAARHKAGAALQSKLLDARARLQLARVDLAAADDRTDSLRRELMSLILSKEPSLVPDTSGAFTLDTLPIPKAARTERPEVVALDHAADRLHNMRKALRYRHFPSVYGTAGLRYGRPGLYTGLDEYMGWGVAGVQLKWNLFNGFRTRAEDGLLKRELDLINIERTRQIETIQRSFELAKRQVAQAGKRLAACEAALEAARALAVDLKNSLAAGTVTSADYLDAVVKQAEAELLVEQSKTAKKSAVINMWFAAGKNIKF